LVISFREPSAWLAYVRTVRTLCGVPTSWTTRSLTKLQLAPVSIVALNHRPSTRTCAIILLAWTCSIYPRDGKDSSRFPGGYGDGRIPFAFLGDHNPNWRKLCDCATPVKDVPLLHSSCKLVWNSAPLTNSPLEESALKSQQLCRWYLVQISSSSLWNYLGGRKKS